MVNLTYMAFVLFSFEVLKKEGIEIKLDAKKDEEYSEIMRKYVLSDMNLLLACLKQFDKSKVTLPIYKKLTKKVFDDPDFNERQENLNKNLKSLVSLVYNNYFHFHTYHQEQSLRDKIIQFKIQLHDAE